MDAALILSPQLDEVWTQLDQVMDPELDEPITDMGFVEAVAISGPGIVSVSFRLPTFWCSPNFAFLMLSDIKRQVEALPWVNRAVVQLEDHMSGDEMSAVVNAGGGFAEVFTDLDQNEDLAALREKFDLKAFQRRQEVVLKALLAMDCPVARIVNMRLGALDDLAFADPEDTRQKARYRALLVAKGLATRPHDLALPTYQGAPLTEAGFKTYTDLLRSVRINMEFSGSLCRGLKQSRYKEADFTGAEPRLVDFILPAG